VFTGYRERAIVLVFLVVSAVSACSGDDVILRSEYAAEVNRLCSATTARIDAALIPVIETYIGGLDMASSDEDALTDDQTMGLYAATLPVAEDLNEVFASMLAEIRELPSPDEDAEVFSEHWDRVEALWNEAHDAIVLASTDPAAARALLAEPDPRLKPTNEAALGLGIEACVFD
jgi:hypothetical protein